LSANLFDILAKEDFQIDGVTGYRRQGISSENTGGDGHLLKQIRHFPRPNSRNCIEIGNLLESAMQGAVRDDPGGQLRPNPFQGRQNLGIGPVQIYRLQQKNGLSRRNPTIGIHTGSGNQTVPIFSWCW
jgi:hypothetical protein